MEDRRVRLKDGREAVIRAVRQGDARQVWACRRAVVEAGVGTIRGVAECDKTEGEIESHTRGFIRRAGKQAGCLLVAEVGGRIVGAGSIRRLSHARVKHVARIGVGVMPAYQGLGLGRAIMEGLIAWARSLPRGDVSRVDLFVFAANYRAVRLYESLGFIVEGRRQRMIRYEDGREEDDLIMALFLE